MPPLVRRVLWALGFGALAGRALKGLMELNEPEPQEQAAEWPELGFDRPTG